MNRFYSPKTLFCSTISIAFCFNTALFAAATDTNWVLDPALSSQLSAASPIGTIGTIQPPKGFTLQEKDSTDGAGSVYQWTGQPGIKGYTPTFDVIIATPPTGSASQFTLDQVMASLISNFHANKQHWKNTPVSIGNVNSHSFHRVDWSALDNQRKLNIQGSVFGTQLANGNFVLISAEDAEPDSKTALPIMDSSALTFVQNDR